MNRLAAIQQRLDDHRDRMGYADSLSVGDYTLPIQDALSLLTDVECLLHIAQAAAGVVQTEPMEGSYFGNQLRQALAALDDTSGAT